MNSDSNEVQTDPIDRNNLQKWVLASNNKGKLAEFERMFSEADLGINLVPQSQLGIEDAIEDGLTFIENALIKARHASRISGLAAIADDSGLCVPLLGNAPGIHSARYAGEHGNDGKNNAKLMKDLEPYRVMFKDKESMNPNDPVTEPIKGYFVCVLVLVRHATDPLPIIAQGLWQGDILNAPLGDEGFGYDPLFWIDDLNKSAAQLDTTTKNQISHRGQALQILLKQIKLNFE